MRESQWLKEFEYVQNEKRQTSNKKKKVMLVIIPMMLLVFILPSLMNGDVVNQQVRNGMFGIVGVFAGILLFMMLMLSIGKKRDVIRTTRNSLQEILKTDEDVERFDAQMNAAPMKVVNISLGTDVILMQDFVAKRFNDCGNLKYRFIRNEDIEALHYKKTGSNTTNPLKAGFFFDIRDVRNQVIMNGLADSDSQLTELEALLKMAQPELSVKKEGGII